MITQLSALSAIACATAGLVGTIPAATIGERPRTCPWTILAWIAVVAASCAFFGARAGLAVFLGTAAGGMIHLCIIFGCKAAREPSVSMISSSVGFAAVSVSSVLAASVAFAGA